MNKFLILVFAYIVLFNGCSKKDTSDNTPPKKDNNTTQQNNNTNTSSNTSSNTTSSPSFYNVKDVVDSKGGKELVDFSWSENGKDMKLSEHKGKVILLNFWATWCPPCRKELPALSEISSEMKDKNFKMLGISVDQESSALTEFLTKNNLSYTVLHDESNIVSKYMKVTSQLDNVIPQSYIIDKNGKIVETIVGSRSKEEFVKLINKYL